MWYISQSMFLALNELRKEKTRFVLIIIVIVLMSYLTFFLTSLAYGLATSYTQGLAKWKADGIVLNKDANSTVERSLIYETEYSEFTGDNTALIGVSGATIDQEEAEDISIFGVDFESFLAPNVTEGRLPQSDKEITVSDELKDLGISINQELGFKGTEQKLTVVGFTNNATFQTAPIIYMNLASWRSLAADLAGMIGMKDQSTVSAVVTRSTSNAAKYNTDTTQWYSIRDFSFSLPGYQAQVLTFGLMVGFLIAIASFVLAVFMYILTLQKKNIFGVLKAEGVPNSYISLSVMTQICLLCAGGLAVGLVLTILSGLALGNTVPFLINWQFFAGIIALFIICAALGGLASVRAVTKIDPVEAIE